MVMVMLVWFSKQLFCIFLFHWNNANVSRFRTLSLPHLSISLIFFSFKIFSRFSLVTVNPSAMSAEDQMWKIYLLEFIHAENNKMIQLFDS